jgi:hypothetical protein
VLRSELLPDRFLCYSCILWPPPNSSGKLTTKSTKGTRRPPTRWCLKSPGAEIDSQVTPPSHTPSDRFLYYLELTFFDVAQALPIGKLREGHAKELVPAGEPAKPGIAAVSLHTAGKRLVGSQAHKLCENGASLVHPLRCEASRQNG